VSTDVAASRRATFALVRPVRGRVVLTSALGAASLGAAIGLLATSAWLIARASQQPSVTALTVAIVGVRFFAVSRGILRYFERLVGHDTAFRELADVRMRAYRKLERLAPTGLTAFRSGDLLARLVDDIDSFQDLMVRVIPAFCIALVVGALTVGLMWLLLPAAGLVLAVALVLAAVPVPSLARALARRSEAHQATARGELATSFVDLLDGAPELVAFGAVDEQLQRVSHCDAELTRIASATARTTGIGTSLTTLLTGLAMWGALLVGVPAVRSGRLDAVLLAVIALVPLAAFELVAPLPAAGQSFERVRRAAARVFRVLDADPPVTDPVSPAALPHMKHTIRIRGLRARYGSGEPWAIDGIDLDLPPGRRVAIVGQSGAGKTTLASVLTRFVPYEGSVELDGIELAQLDGEDVRRVIGVAEADPHIFDTTLRENLLLARRDASEADLRVALATAQLLDWVNDLPRELDTPVGVHGAHLSGGQRQRLSLARVVLADFPVLVLDEPDEHLDAETTDALAHDLVTVTEGRTTLTITHRVRDLHLMDEVLVLEAGHVVERGTHDELVAAGGRYARLALAEMEPA